MFAATYDLPQVRVLYFNTSKNDKQAIGYLSYYFLRLSLKNKQNLVY